jgi:hypothetical protein
MSENKTEEDEFDPVRLIKNVVVGALSDLPPELRDKIGIHVVPVGAEGGMPPEIQAMTERAYGKCREDLDGFVNATKADMIDHPGESDAEGWLDFTAALASGSTKRDIPPTNPRILAGLLTAAIYRLARQEISAGIPTHACDDCNEPGGRTMPQDDVSAGTGA